MKKILCLFFVILMFLTGCAAPAATPETEAAQPTEEPQGMLLSSLEVPERFTGDWTGVEGLVTVHADASVELPDVDTIPIATVKRRSFTDEDAEKLITYFCGDAPFNQPMPVYETRQFAQKQVERYQKIKRGEMEATGDLVDHIRVEGEAYLDKRIADYQKMLETAPDAEDRFPASRKFEPGEYMNIDHCEFVNGFAELPDKNVTVYMRNVPAGKSSTIAMAYVEGYGGYGDVTRGLYSVLEDGKTPTKCSLTQEQAVQTGDEFMKALGATDMVCTQTRGVMFIIRLSAKGTDEVMKQVVLPL